MKEKRNTAKGFVYSHKTIIAVLALVAAVGGYGGYTVTKDTGYAPGFDQDLHRIVEVLDGDTVVLEDDTRVRLLGIDAPEVARAGGAGECYGQEAKDALFRMVAGRDVYLDKDAEAVDRQGRLLRYVFIRDNSDPEVGDVFVNRELVRMGAAQSRWIAPNRRYLELVNKSEVLAKEEKAGMWGECQEELSEELSGRDQSQADESSPDSDCQIKGNISTKDYGKIYFLPNCPNYGRTKIDPSLGDRWFCAESEAVDAGFVKSASCPG